MCNKIVFVHNENNALQYSLQFGACICSCGVGAWGYLGGYCPLPPPPPEYAGQYNL